MPWTTRRRTLAVLLLPLAAGLVSAQSNPVRVSGRVVSAATGRPIPNAQVMPQLLPASDAIISARTDAEGRFDLSSLALSPNRYTIRAFATGYVTSAYGDEAGLGPRPIVLRAGEPVTGIEFQLHRGATIAGRVVDERKEPVVATSVAAFERRWNFGEFQFMRVTSVSTDDRGQFRLIGLAPGEYVVGAINKASIAFAPASTLLKDATRIVVKADEERAGVDIRAPQTPVGAIDGTFVGPGGANVYLVAEASDVASPSQLSRPGPNGHFVFEDVLAGRYFLVARPEGTAAGRGSSSTMWARQSVVVRGNETTTASLALQPAARISGATESGRARDASLQVLGTAHPEANMARPSLGVDGSFTLLVGPGRYRWLRTQESIFVLSLFQKDLDIADLPLDVTPGLVLDGLRMVVNEPARIVGRLLDRDGKPTTRGGVVVAATDRRYWTGVSRRLTVVRADANGDFVAPRMPPGEYFVAHVDSLAPGQLSDAAFLRGLPQTTKVTVVAGKDATVELRLK